VPIVTLTVAQLAERRAYAAASRAEHEQEWLEVMNAR
jgi:hypothetical protein